jgi:hypothetical protein
MILQDSLYNCTNEVISLQMPGEIYTRDECDFTTNDRTYHASRASLAFSAGFYLHHREVL